jgi:hypothetical protein
MVAAKTRNLAARHLDSEWKAAARALQMQDSGDGAFEISGIALGLMSGSVLRLELLPVTPTWNYPPNPKVPYLEGTSLLLPSQCHLIHPHRIKYKTTAQLVNSVLMMSRDNYQDMIQTPHQNRYRGNLSHDPASQTSTATSPPPALQPADRDGPISPPSPFPTAGQRSPRAATRPNHHPEWSSVAEQ